MYTSSTARLTSGSCASSYGTTSSIAPDSLYAKIGLQNGDVLQQINGVEIKDPENFMRVFQQLKDETNIALDFVRNNRRESFAYEIR